jgi:hypothetical protein
MHRRESHVFHGSHREMTRDEHQRGHLHRSARAAQHEVRPERGANHVDEEGRGEENSSKPRGLLSRKIATVAEPSGTSAST